MLKFCLGHLAPEIGHHEGSLMRVLPQLRPISPVGDEGVSIVSVGTLCVSGSGAQLCYSLEGTPIQILTIHPSQQIDSPDLVLLLIEVCADKIETFCTSIEKLLT